MKELHENFILLHTFEHGASPKNWVIADEYCIGEYHISLDWLKPVIDKIGKMDLSHEPLANVSLYSTVEEIYKEVVEFVKSLQH